MSDAYDLVIKGARVVDGTGLPAYGADVAVRDGRITRIGKVGGPARETIAADGLLLTPGFIDVHTHYDPQLHWEPTASPASWHGVTTVLAGNCGFTLAPARPADCEWLSQMLSRVEGMSPGALSAGVRWHGGTFGSFLDALEGRIGVNCGVYVGHSAVRRFVMGDAASERTADADQVRRMQDLVRAAMREGAIGFSTSQLDIHVAHDGREVPSNHASPDEIVALASVVGEFEHGAIEIIPRTFADGYSAADRELLRSLYRVTGRPIELNTLVPMIGDPDGWRRSLEFARAAFRDGMRIHPMFASHQLGAHLTLDSTFLFDDLKSFREVLTLPAPERARRLRDPAVRMRMLEDLANPEGRTFLFTWQVMIVEGVADPAHVAWVGRSVSDLADEQGTSPLDCFLDMALSEDLATQFALVMPPDDGFARNTEELIRDPILMAGSSDGGAHLLSFVGADYTTRLLTDWVPRALGLEAAVSRLTMMPAVVHGLFDRGVVREGAAADLVLIDPSRLRVGATRLVRDFPGESARYVVDAEGYVATIVNGEVLLRDGRHTGALPGRVLRPR